MSEPVDDAKKARFPPWLKGLASVVFGVALLVGVLPRFANLSDVWGSIKALTLLQVLALLGVATWNVLTYQFQMMAALPGLSLRHAFLTGQISTAVANTMPAGAVVGVGVTYGLLASFGHGGAPIALASVLTGWWNTLAKLAFPLAALLALALHGEINEALLSAAGIGFVILVGAVVMLLLILNSESFARTVGSLAQRFVSAILRIFGRGPVTGWPDSFSHFREESAVLLRRRWHWLTAATALSHLSLFYVLLLVLRLLGVPATDVTWYEALGAFAFVNLATAFPITPGGIGLVEVGLSAALVLAGGDEPLVVAAVLLYRAVTYLFQVILGVLSYGAWRLEMHLVAGRSPAGAG